MLVFDAHLDLAMNAIEWNRDLTRSLDDLRQREAHLRDKPDRGRATVSFPEMRRAGIGICVATQIARVEHNAYSPVAGWASPAQAWAMTQAQRAWYGAMEEAGEIRILRDRGALEAQIQLWSTPTPEDAPPRPIGCILSLEGADSLITLDHLERAWQYGLRAIGPAHYGPGVYAQGTSTVGGFNARGRDLLRAMERRSFILDVTHLSDECFREALDLYGGPIWASHHVCRAFVPHQRQLPDEFIRELAARGAVIGMAMDAWMLVPGWVRGESTPESMGVSLETVANHIDHICQLTGSAAHVGIGTDLDGAYGHEQTPQDLKTIADITQLADRLKARGWSGTDVEAVMHANFLRFLRQAWQ
jgi:membrane dipeptidase